jgi:hypothetical protein
MRLNENRRLFDYRVDKKSFVMIEFQTYPMIMIIIMLMTMIKGKLIFANDYPKIIRICSNELIKIRYFINSINEWIRSP